MSQSAPWNYGGAPQTQGTGAVKMFNPADFNAAGNVPTSNYGNITQNFSSASGATNGHEQNQTPGQWDFNPSQWNSYDAQGQVDHTGQGQGVKGQIPAEGHHQNSETNTGNVGVFQENQYYDPQQQYCSQPYWNNVDQTQQQDWPNQQNWQGQPVAPYNYAEQNWVNSADSGGQYGSIPSQIIPVSGAENSQKQPGGEHLNYYNRQLQGQEHIQGQGQVNSDVDPLDSSVASTDASESLNQSLNEQGQGTVAGYYGDNDTRKFNLMGQNEMLLNQQSGVSMNLTDNNVQHSSESLETNPQNIHLQSAQTTGACDVVEGMTSQFNSINLEGQSELPKQVFQPEVTQESTLNNQNQSAAKGQGSSVVNAPDTSQTSSDPQGMSDWEMVPPQTLGVPPSNHSRQGSADNNVQFFIGSSRNSPSAGTGSSASSVHGHGSTEDGTQGVPLSSGETARESAVAAEIKEQAAFLTSPMMPKYTSSPNVDVRLVDNSAPEVTGPPPPTMPPSGSGVKGDNPFRKGGPKSGLQTATLASIPDETRPVSQGPEEVHLFDTSSAKPQISNTSVSSMFSGNECDIEPPSPIASPEDYGRTRSSSHSTPKPQPQSPIMPRKESPFQPPLRRRNTSGSSETIEENSKLENLEELMSGKHENKDIEKYRKSELSSRRSSGSDSLDKSDKELVHNQDSSNRSYPRGQRDRDRDRYRRSKPPPGPSSGSRGVLSPRRMEKVLQQSQAQRAKHNMSPATTLWADSGVLSSSNIILAPAAPLPAVVPPASSAVGNSLSSTALQSKAERRDTHGVLTPVENLISSLTEHISKESTPEREQGIDSHPSSNTQIQQSQSEPRKSSSTRDRHERNSSIDRELEICRNQEEAEKRKGNGRYDERENDRRPREGEHYSQRDQFRDSRYEQGYDRETRDRRDPRDFRNEDYDAYYKGQPRVREGYKGGAAPLRDPYKDAYYGEERYDRPRSRSSVLDDEQQRPSSRQGHERPRSRQDYSRDPYYRDKYGRSAYDYDYYGRQDYYYDNRYYDQSRGYYGDNRYAKAYVDEYYGGQYNEQFNRLLDFNSYYGYPNDYYGQGYEDDRYSQRSQSRVQTPGSLSDVGEQADQYGYGSRSSSRVGYDEYQRAQYDYYYGRGGYYQDSYQQQQESVPGRMTPAKYHIPHMKACFGPGGELVKVLPNRPTDGQPATVEIHELTELLQENLETEELKAFPGPLVRGDTHKNDVLMFCQRKAKSCAENISLMDRESAELLWKLLELLIKQNGNVVGTDIADLLLDGHEPTTVDYSIMGMRISQSMDNLDEEMDSTADTSNITADRSIIPRGQAREEVTDRFRHLLLYGRKKDALDWAMKKNLWGHALFLASKMDNRTHANVMTRFANSAMKINDPLQTLYQLMSGRQPASVTSIADERWGDWRPHLAMILSNHSNKPDLDRKSIMSLGDTLAAKRFLHASQFCYLMAQISFGSYHKKTSKLVLIGSNHSLPLGEFATNEAIQCTEIYEYAMSLGSAAFFLVNFQYFKFLYACRLAENGFPQEALHYCDVISRYIQRSPTMFQPTLVKLVHNLADRLKHFDPQRLHMGEDAEDPYWLQQLKRISQGFEDGTIRPISGSVTPMGFGGMTRSSSESGEVANYTQTGTSDLVNNTANQSQLIYGQDSFYQQQQGYGHTADQSQVQQETTGMTAYTDQQMAGQEQYGVQHPTHNYSQQQNQNYSQQQMTGAQQETHSYSHPTTAEQEQHGMGQQPEAYNAEYSYGQFGTVQQEAGSQESANHNVHTMSNSANHYQAYSGGTENQYHNYTAQESNTGNVPSHTQTHSLDHSNYGKQMRQHQQSTATTESDSEEEDEETDGDPESSLGGSHNSVGGGFDYFTAATQRPIVAPKLRKRTASETSNASGNNQRHHESGSKSAMPPPKPPVKNSDDKKTASKGIFGGLFSKFMSKPKNEIKLPNDTNPSIVWDDVKKKWVNTDEPEEDEALPVAPPKDSDVLGGSVSATKPTSNASELPQGGALSIPPMGNKYTKPKGRGARAQYVDVMNPKPTTTNVPNSLFNVMPTSQSAPAIFNPAGSMDDAEPAQTSATDSHNAQQGNSLPPSGNEIASTGEAKPETNTQEPAGLPMMFNPAQFSTGQQAINTSVSTGGPRRYGQRRVYPK